MLRDKKELRPPKRGGKIEGGIQSSQYGITSMNKMCTCVSMYGLYVDSHFCEAKIMQSSGGEFVTLLIKTSSAG